MGRRGWVALPHERFLVARFDSATRVGSLLAPIAIIFLFVCSCFDLSSSFPPTASAFSTFALGETRLYARNSDSILHAYKPVVVVGKIIIDEYGDPYPNSDGENEQESEAPAPPKTVSIGGGGPQAAFGAAAALAVWDKHFKNRDDNLTILSQSASLPPIIFVAPVGKDWTQSETTALESSFGASASIVVHNNTVGDFVSIDSDDRDDSLIQTHLVIRPCGDDGFFTPRIRLWHDINQTVHWYALNDSFGPEGADGLWRYNPSAKDLASILERGDSDKSENNIVLHAIAETWTGAAGGKLDVLPLLQDDDTALRNNLAFVGIEPVASGEIVTKEDAKVAASVLETCCEAIARMPSCNTVFWCPDRELDQAISTNNLYQTPSNSTSTKSDLVRLAAIRDGPRGSTTRIINSSLPNDELHVPAATLVTDDGSPIDPTGAGNAYSGAMTALLGNQVPFSTAACIATGVGAVVCEYEGLPPASDWQITLNRIASAAREVDSKMT